ncbi:MAG TPA: hypothetical protein VKR32_11400 [Puia sp.]|nr:hypothetical protein [Puia sp.]
MKKGIYQTLILLVILYALQACVKNSTGTKSKGSGNSIVTLSKSTIERGEQVTASTNESNAIVKWKTNPSSAVILYSTNQNASATFALAGSYTITASYFSAADTLTAYDSASSPVTVTDSIYQPGGVTDGDSLYVSGDLVISPLAASDTSIIFSVTTKNLYYCTSYLTAYGGLSTSNAPIQFLFNWAEVVDTVHNCNGVQNPASAILFFGPQQFGANLSTIPNGQYVVYGTVNQQTYQGSMSITDQYLTFTWNYTSGIIISPLQIKKG